MYKISMDSSTINLSAKKSLKHNTQIKFFHLETSQSNCFVTSPIISRNHCNRQSHTTHAQLHASQATHSVSCVVVQYPWRQWFGELLRAHTAAPNNSRVTRVHVAWLCPSGNTATHIHHPSFREWVFREPLPCVWGDVGGVCLQCVSV